MSRVLSEVVAPAEGTALWVKRIALVALGVVALAIASKIRIPMWPVPITMQTFVVLSVGAAYGLRLGVVTMLAYLAAGALGFDVFANSVPMDFVAIITGPTGGYLIGFVLAAGFMGVMARRGWDRSVGKTVVSMTIAYVFIMVPGVLWLGVVLGWDRPILDLGLWPFLPGAAVKIALAAAVFPAAWRMVGDARA